MKAIKVFTLSLALFAGCFAGYVTYSHFTVTAEGAYTTTWSNHTYR